MNKEDVNRLAREAGAAVGQVMPDGQEIIFPNCMDVHLFASLVIQQENRDRKWHGLTEKDFSAINQSCLTKLQAATSAESILKEKNS